MELKKLSNAIFINELENLALSKYENGDNHLKKILHSYKNDYSLHSYKVGVTLKYSMEKIIENYKNFQSFDKLNAVYELRNKNYNYIYYLNLHNNEINIHKLFEDNEVVFNEFIICIITIMFINNFINDGYSIYDELFYDILKKIFKKIKNETNDDDLDKNLKKIELIIKCIKNSINSFYKASYNLNRNNKFIDIELYSLIKILSNIFKLVKNNKLAKNMIYESIKRQFYEDRNDSSNKKFIYLLKINVFKNDEKFLNKIIDKYLIDNNIFNVIILKQFKNIL